MSNSSALRFPPFPLENEERAASPQITSSRNQADGDEDEALICRMGQGDRDACSCLFRRYAELIRNVGRRILRDDAESDDLVQEVFLYLYRKWAVFDCSKGSGRSWIFQVTYTQAFIRRRHLNSIGFYTTGILDLTSENGPTTNSGADYDQTVEALFGRNGWKQVLDSLTDEQRETLRLHFFEGYTFKEIAEKLGQSYANVRHHHYRGLEKLRKHLTEDGSGRR